MMFSKITFPNRRQATVLSFVYSGLLHIFDILQRHYFLSIFVECGTYHLMWPSFMVLVRPNQN